MAEGGRHDSESDTPNPSRRLARRQQMMRLIPEFFASGASVDSFMNVPRVLAVFGEHLMQQNQRVQECLTIALAATERLDRPRQRGFAEHLLEDKSELDFFRNVRVTKQTFTDLVSLIDRAHQTRYSGGFPPLTNEECVMVSLWYLGTNSSFKEISALFGYGESCIFQSVQKFLNIICAEADTCITWPTHDEAFAIENEFKLVAGFPGVIGAMDGCRIKIKVPKDVQADYIDRNNRHSITLLAVCDNNKKFTYIDAGFPGSAHDNRVYRCSTLGSSIMSQPRQMFPSKSYHIIGDSEFQLSTYLLTPYKDYGALTCTQRKYNTKLSETWIVIENAFSWLKGRFKRLKYIDAKVDKAKQIVQVCCVLHNISLGNPQEQQYLADELEGNDNFEEIYNAIDLPEIEGRKKRDFVASLL